ncbi:P-loop containing nucleoside triphosphate hydrolase protein [Biscogniauxia mediterranea]|nr:P-loop containing nucleoside triphosphate hydrolase protein [Biscogniauxia mediterranea]
MPEEEPKLVREILDTWSAFVDIKSYENRESARRYLSGLSNLPRPLPERALSKAERLFDPYLDGYISLPLCHIRERLDVAAITCLIESPVPQTSEVVNPTTNFAHPDFVDIGIKLKAFNDTLGTLQQLGIQHVATLPELVLVGDQSSGKSSLTRLDLPKSSGICTRCPFHIRMTESSSSHYSCSVSLQQDYDYKPTNRRLKESDVTRSNPLPPWHPKQSRDTKEFKTIYEQNAVEIGDILRWAQIATLNPTRNHKQYIPGKGVYAKEHSLEEAKDDMEARFSPNILYDLPGIFANAEDKEDDYLVKVVKNLTFDYVRRQEAIIMLALPIDVDKENSMTMKTIRDADAETRTIGVITKADKLTPDKIDTWMDVLRGKKETVGHGCFITSLPANNGLDGLVQCEESFFYHGTSNWPKAFDRFGDRCGVEHLRQYVTKQLGLAFSRNIPTIKEKVEEKLNEIRTELKNLPELPENVEYVVRMSLRNFCERVRYAVTNSDFEFRWKTLNMRFYETIVAMKPLCTGLQVRKPEEPPIEIHDSESELSETVPRKRPAQNEINTPSTKRVRQDLLRTPVKQEARSLTMATSAPPSISRASLLDDAPNPFVGCTDARSPMDVNQIRKEIVAKTRAGFSNIVPVEVHETLSLEAIRKWEEPLNIYINQSMQMLAETVIGALEFSFDDLRRRLIFKESQDYLVKFLDEHEALQRARLVELFHNETYKMDTINHRSMEQFKMQELETLERPRAFWRIRAASNGDTKVTRLLKEMSPGERVKEKRLLNECLAKLPEDPYKMEIEVAATVRAYYLTAATRFVDAVTMDVNSRLFRGFREGSLDYYLEKELGLHPYPSPAVYTHLMEEEESTSHTRQQLKKDEHKLVKAIESILTLEDSPESDSGHRDVKYQSSITESDLW